jgi:hypothetical protein
MAQPQSFKNHTRFDPQFHFVLIPLLLLNLIFAIYATIHSWPGYMHTHLWWIVMAIVFLGMAGLSRGYALKNQDRLIRLEEQLRLADLLDDNQLGLIEALTVDQFVGLRFASDAEVAALAQRAVIENLDRKQIKQAIINWRPDNHRI